MTETIVAVGWMHIANNALLMVRPRGGDGFYLPGGKPEVGESLRDAVMREVNEELGVKLATDSVQLAFTFVDEAHGRPNTFVELHCFWGQHVGELQASGEIVETRWCTSSDIDGNPVAAARTLLARLWKSGLIA